MMCLTAVSTTTTKRLRFSKAPGTSLLRAKSDRPCDGHGAATTGPRRLPGKPQRWRLVRQLHLEILGRSRREQSRFLRRSAAGECRSRNLSSEIPTAAWRNAGALERHTAIEYRLPRPTVQNAEANKVVAQTRPCT